MESFARFRLTTLPALLLALAAIDCTQRQPPPVQPAAPPVVQPAAKVDVSTNVAPAAAPQPPTVQTQEGVDMQGPFPSIAALCATQKCDWLKSADRPADPTLECESPLKMEKPPGAMKEVFFQTMDCRVANIRDGGRSYFLVLHRADGYWLSNTLAHLDIDSKGCSAPSSAIWEARQVIAGGAEEVVVRLAATSDCLACNKQGSALDTNEQLIVLADRPGQKPVYFPPHQVGTRHKQAVLKDGDNNDCPPEDEKDLREISWSADGQLTLRGTQPKGNLPTESVRYVMPRIEIPRIE